jgi:ribosome recycling factor
VTKELRAGMVKQAKEKGEEAKNQIRTQRSDAMQQLKKMGKNEDVHRIEKLIQKAIDDANKKITDAVAAKEKEIMSA